MNAMVEGLKRVLDILKTLAEIVAVIVAGYWTYRVFVVTESPSLNGQTDVSSALSWETVDGSKRCMEDFELTISNKGKTAMEVEELHLCAWTFKMDELLRWLGSDAFVDLGRLKGNLTLLSDMTVKHGRLIHYLN